MAELCRNYAGTMAELCRNYAGSMQELYIAELCRNDAGTMAELCRNYAGTMAELCRNYAGSMQELWLNYAGTMQELPYWQGKLLNRTRIKYDSSWKVIIWKDFTSNAPVREMGKIWKDIASNVMVPQKYKTEKISHQIWKFLKVKNWKHDIIYDTSCRNKAII